MEVIEYSFDKRENEDFLNEFKKMKNGAYALGFFDGVHIGHRKIIEETVAVSKRRNLVPSVYTFKAEDENIKSNSTRLFSTENKIEIFKSLGIQRVILCDFSSVKDLEPADFVTRVLCNDLKCEVALCGYNFRFGKYAKGDIEMLDELLTGRKCELKVISELKKDGKTVSTTAIREALSVGDVPRANAMLGVPYFISGTVKRGMGKGKDFGFPTVNTDIEINCPLRHGVYRTVVPIGEKLYTGVTNIGVCPTFSPRVSHAETFICDFCEDLYGEKLKVYFMEFLRDEKVFSNGEELAKQIEKDKNYSKERNGDLKWEEIGLN